MYGRGGRAAAAGGREAGATSGRPLHQTRQVCGTVADTEGGGGGVLPGAGCHGSGSRAGQVGGGDLGQLQLEHSTDQVMSSALRCHCLCWSGPAKSGC